MADFDESKHPRAKDGEFGSGGGKASPNEPAAKTGETPTKEEKGNGGNVDLSPHLSELHDWAKNQPRELRIAIDGTTGKVIAKSEGQKGSGKFGDPSEEAAWDTPEKFKSWMDSENVIDIHSHPANDAPPSDGDWGQLGWGNIRKMGIVEKDGTVWMLEKTPKFDALEYGQRTPRALKESYSKYLDDNSTVEKEWTPEQLLQDVQKHMADTFHIKITKTKLQ